MNAPTSRLQQRLETEIIRARDPVACAMLRAERACLLARLGDMDGAAAEREALAVEAQRHPAPGLAIWLKLLDGTLGYYRGADTSHRTAFSQAMELAHRARLRPLIALSAIWLAQMAFVDDEIEPMVRLLSQALQESTPQQHGVRARVAMLIALNYHYAFRVDLAQPWYQRAQQHASAEGDVQTLSALMYTRAWTSGNQCRMASIFGTPMPESSSTIRQAVMSAQSSEHFDRRTGAQALQQLTPLLEAQLLTTQGRWAEADALFSRHLDAEPGLDGVQRYLALLLGDWAWCRLQLGDVEGARRHADRSAAALAAHDCAQDDRTVALGRLARLHAAFGDEALAQQHEAEAQQELARFGENQQRVLTALDAALRQTVL